MRQEIDADTDGLAREVVDAALKVHKALGPGLLESVYEACLAHELKSRSITFETQISLPIIYEDVRLDAGLRLDMIVAKRLIVELKAVETLLPIHESQLITYLKLSGLRLGLLINFNVRMLRDGIKRIAY
jgi:GxxExxY protein